MTHSLCASTGTLKCLIMSHYLFDEDFNFEEDAAKDPRLNLVAQGLFDELVAATHPGRPDLAMREWHIPSDATPFAMVRAVFASVIDKDTLCPTPAQRGDLAEYYRFLRNETLKESRLTFWNVLAGGFEPLRFHASHDPFARFSYLIQAAEFSRRIASGTARGIDRASLRKFTGNEVKELFQDWLTVNSKCLECESLDLCERNLRQLPPEIGLFPRLQNLILDRNSLTELPSEIGYLTELRLLSVEGNKLRMLPPEIGKLTKLEVLNLTGILSLKELPQEMENLTQLHSLYLEGLEVLPRFLARMNILVHVSLSLFESLPLEVQTLGIEFSLDNDSVVLSKRHFKKLEEVGYHGKPSSKASRSYNNDAVPRMIYALMGVILLEALVALIYQASTLSSGKD